MSFMDQTILICCPVDYVGMVWCLPVNPVHPEQRPY